MNTTNFKNKTKVNRAMHDKEHTYTLISNELLRDERLNYVEISIMLSILSNDDSFIFNSTHVQKKLGIGDDKWSKSMKKLQNLGYIEKRRINAGIEWTINEIPKNTIIIPKNTTSEIEKNTTSDFTKNTSSENTSSENTTNEEIIIPTEHNKEYSCIEQIIKEETKEIIDNKRSNNSSLIEKFEKYINTCNGNLYFDTTECYEHINEHFDNNELYFILNNINKSKTLKLKQKETAIHQIQYILPSNYTNYEKLDENEFEYNYIEIENKYNENE